MSFSKTTELLILCWLHFFYIYFSLFLYFFGVVFSSGFRMDLGKDLGWFWDGFVMILDVLGRLWRVWVAKGGEGEVR